MDRRILRVVTLVRSDLKRPWKLRDLAAQVHLSESRFRHLASAELGSSFIQYLRHLRLSRARELADATDLSIKEIMSEVGFNDESHFVRDFERQFGLSPRRYRARRTEDLGDKEGSHIG